MAPRVEGNFRRSPRVLGWDWKYFGLFPATRDMDSKERAKEYLGIAMLGNCVVP